MARIMDKWTGIRSIVGAPNGSHDSFMCWQPQRINHNTNGQAPGVAEHRRDDFQTARRRQGRYPAVHWFGPEGGIRLMAPAVSRAFLAQAMARSSPLTIARMT